MLALLMLAATAGAPPPDPWLATPDDVWTSAFLSLNDDTAPEDRPYTRFLWAPDDRVSYPQVINYTLNATSFRSEFGHVEQLGGRLVRLDLRAFQWDFGSRKKRLAELARRGVRFDREAELADPWEVLARADPYFIADHKDGNTFHRGWLDTNRVNAARQLSRSLKPVLRADFFISKVLNEKAQGGIYSDTLLLPASEGDLFKSLLIDIAAVERDGQLRQGGAILESIVALHNRELQMIPSLYGHGSNRYVWQTFDFDSDERGDKSVLERFAGTVKRDGRETIGSLPNGLTFVQLFNGKGERVDAVPENIAQIKIPQDRTRETRVLGGYSCIKCHQDGIREFSDVVRKAFLNPAARLLTKAGSAGKSADLAERVEDYYNQTLPDTIKAQQQAYAARLKAACGMTGNEMAQAVTEAVEAYPNDLVDEKAAAREMGYSLDLARLAWQASLNPELTVLATGQALRRAAWEGSFADAMRSAIDLKRRLGKAPNPNPDPK